jgi:predicted transcriptional regulator
MHLETSAYIGVQCRAMTTSLDGVTKPKVDVRELVRLRYEAGLSATELAYRAGLSQHTVARIERGESQPTPRTLRALADVLGVNVSQLTSVDEP